MDILYALEKIRTPFWNGVMSAVTQLGGEVIFIVAAVVVFWCVSKWEGYYLMTVAFCGTVLNQFLKLICRVPRPWVRDPNFTIVESARAEATGYSFPSGHTQNAIGLFGGMARWGGRRWVRLGLTALALIIASAVSPSGRGGVVGTGGGAGAGTVSPDAAGAGKAPIHGLCAGCHAGGGFCAGAAVQPVPAGRQLYPDGGAGDHAARAVAR